MYTKTTIKTTIQFQKKTLNALQFDNSVYLHGNTRRGVFYTGGRWVDGNTRRGVYTGGRWEDGGITISVFTWTYEERSLLHCGGRWEDGGIRVFTWTYEERSLLHWCEVRGWGYQCICICAWKINYISNRYIIWKAEAETANPICQIKAHHRSQRVQNWNVFHPLSNTDYVIYSHMAKVGTLGDFCLQSRKH